jgi:hypothetical protein
MNETAIERGLVASLRAVFEGAELDLSVRAGSDNTPVASTARYVLVNCLDATNEVEDLYTVRMALAVVSPRLGPPSLVDGHETAVRNLERSFRACMFAVHAAGIWQAAGYVLHGWDIEMTDRYLEDGRMVEGLQIVFGIEACLGGQGKTLPWTLLSIAAPMAPTLEVDGVQGEQWLIDTRGAAAPITYNVPSLQGQVLVYLIGTGISAGVEWDNDIVLPAGSVEIPAGSLVALSIGWLD